MADSTTTPPDDRREPRDEETAPREARKDTLAVSGGSDFKHGRFEPGQRLGSRYRIVALLGQGGMGEVYRADDLELGQSVALKFLPERVAADESWLRRFRNEVRTARQVAHPNVCRIYDIAEQDGHVFLSMEYVDGEDLSSVLRRLGRPSPEKAIEIARQICLGLAAAHESNVLHRDLKPANIMIDGRGRVRITDFGLAGFLDELEGVEARAGTPAYMAPEQLAHGKVSVRSDIYSLGLILHELFTGRCVFETNDIEELKRKHTSGSVTPPSSITEEIDPAVERVIMRCLEQEPEHRPQSVYQVLAALPGGDPLAAALAAGETPSPELVANARDAGGLSRRVAAGLLLTLIASFAVMYSLAPGKTIMPEKSPTELSVIAKQIMEEVGYDDLHGNALIGYDINYDLFWSHRFDPLPFNEIRQQQYPPAFRFWKRWTDGSFRPVNEHAPELFDSSWPALDATYSADIWLDHRGRLVGLRVSNSQVGVPAVTRAEANWSSLFTRAGFDQERSIEKPLVKRPPVICDTVTAWDASPADDVGESLVVQMGSLDGKPNYFEIIGLNDQFVQTKMVPPFVGTIAGNMKLRYSILAIMVFLAIRNMVAGRGDRRSAIRFALIIGGLYALLELFAIPIGGQLTLERAFGVTRVRPFGHVIYHALEGWVIYMAVEPYVRRVWPSMLIGEVRLLSGRWRDPAVGREVLVGVVTGCGLMAALTLVLAVIVRTRGIDEFGQFPFLGSLLPALSPPHFMSMKAHRAAWGTVDAAFFVGILIAIRMCIRNTPLAVGVGTVMLGAIVNRWGFLEGAGVSSTSLAGVLCSLTAGATLVLLYTKVGILSGIVAAFVFVPHGLFNAGFGAWYSPYGIAELAILIGIAAYGFWVSLAGQPIFKDMLAEPQPAAQ